MRRFRPAVAAEIPGFNPERKTIFIELDQVLTLTSRTFPPNVSADAAFATKKQANVVYPKIRTKPFSKRTYERLPDEYAIGPHLGGLPFPKERSDREELPMNLFLRPYTREFLRALRSNGSYQVIAFTHMMKEQADTIIDFIEGRGPDSEGETFFDGRLYQENCCWVPVQAAEVSRRLLQPDVVMALGSSEKRVYYVKSLANAVPSADLKNCILLDSDGACCAANLRNSLCVTPFCGEQSSYLLSILEPLMTYVQASDVREVIMRGELYRAWISYQHKERHSLPDLSAEGHGDFWALQHAPLYKPEIPTIRPSTGRKICFRDVTSQGELA